MQQVSPCSCNTNFCHLGNKVAEYFRPVKVYRKKIIKTQQEEVDAFFSEIRKIKPNFDSKNNNAKVLNPKVQRCLDIILASILAIPVLLTTAIATSIIKIVEKDMPVMHIPTRYGYKDKGFKMYKIRTSRTTDDGWRHRSRFASFLRKYSIDEFPQILNVFKGEMSFMGSRPVNFKDLREYSVYADKELLVQWLSVKPGFGFGYEKGRKLPKPRPELEKEFLENRGFTTYLKTIKALFLTVIKGNNL